MSLTITASAAPLDEQHVGRWYGTITALERQAGNKNSQYGGADQLIWKLTNEGYIHVDPNFPTQANPQPKGPEFFIGKQMWGFTGLEFTPRSKLRKWVQQILGRQLAEGEQFDLLQLQGRRVQFEIGRSENDRAKVVNITAYADASPAQGHNTPQAYPPQAPAAPQQQTYQAPPQGQYPPPAQIDPNAAYAQQHPAQFQQAQADNAAVTAAMQQQAPPHGYAPPQPQQKAYGQQPQQAPQQPAPPPFEPPF